MPVRLKSSEEAVELVDVIGAGPLFMVEGRMIRQGDKAAVPAVVAHMLVARGRAIFAEGNK
jgi:hypothetical protein